MDNSPDLFAALEAAAREIQEERQALDAREDALRRAREALQGADGNGSTPTATRVRSRAGLQQKVAQHHLDAISEHLAKRQQARQADIAKALGLNSGIVSRAMRELEEAGKVRSLPEKERASLVWEAIGPAARRRSSDRTAAGSRS